MANASDQTPFDRPVRVLVTGGAGFLGTYVVSALAQAGHVATAYDRAHPTPDLLTVHDLSKQVRIGAIDDLPRLIDVLRSDRVDVVVHLVAKVGVEPSLEDPLGFYQTNIMGTATVCEAARQAGVRRLILISSSSVYHHSPGPALLETDPLYSITRANPLAHYGTSKMASEAIGMAYGEFHGVDFIALRVSAIYGFGMRAAINVKPLVEGAVLGQPVRLASGGRMKRDYIHVLDVARAVVRAVEAPSIAMGSPRVFNVSSATLCEIAELASIVRRVVPGSDIDVSMTMTPYEEENVKTRLPLANDMAWQAFGWKPEWSLELGIKQYADAFRTFVETTG